MTRTDVNVFRCTNAFDVETSDCTGLDLFVSKYRNLLLRLIEQAHCAIRAPYRYDVFDGSDRVRNHRGVCAVERLRDLAIDAHVHQALPR